MEVAKQLLREDGFIAIAIDHCELFYLGVLADEIFGRENRIGVISVLHHPGGRTNEAFLAIKNEYMLLYSKVKEKASLGRFDISESIKKTYNREDYTSVYKRENLMRKGETRNARRKDRPKQFYPIYVSNDMQNISLSRKSNYMEIFPIENGIEWVWSFSPSTLQRKINEGDIELAQKNGEVQIFIKRRITDYEGTKPTTTWYDKRYNAGEYGKKELEKDLGFKSRFVYPKSVFTVMDIIQISTGEDDIILDFFAGSGTTGRAILDLNKMDGGKRRFILCEQLDEHFNICKERLNKVVNQRDGKDLFHEKANPNRIIALELMKYNQLFVDRIKAARKTKDLLDIYETLKEKAFLSYQFKEKEFRNNMKNFQKLDREGQKRILHDILDKNQLHLNYSEIDDAKFQVSAKDKKLNKQFYG